WRDPKRDAISSLIFPPHKTLLAPHTIRLDDPPVLVRDEREREPEFLRKRIMRFDRIDTDAEDHRAFCPKRGEAIAKRARLLRATGRVILWIEIQDDILSFEIGERNGSSAARRRGEFRRLVPFLQPEFGRFAHGAFPLVKSVTFVSGRVVTEVAAGASQF